MNGEESEDEDNSNCGPYFDSDWSEADDLLNKENDENLTNMISQHQS